MYYKVHTWLLTQLVVFIHLFMGRHSTLTGTIYASAERPGEHSTLVQIVQGDNLHYKNGTRRLINEMH